MISPALELGVEVAGVGLEQCLAGFDGYGLTERPHLQPEIHAGDGVHRDRDVLLHVFLEAGQGDAHRVVPGIKLTNR